MLKFYVIEISVGDRSIMGKAVYEYESRDAAIAAYHQKMSTAMKSTLYYEELILVVDNYGDVLVRDLFKREG